MTRNNTNYFSYNSRRFKKDRMGSREQYGSGFDNSLKYVSIDSYGEFFSKILNQPLFSKLLVNGNSADSSSLVYQAVALFLLTVGLFLSFQNFSSNKNNYSSVSQTQAEMVTVNQNRIWTNNSLIDSGSNKFELNLAPVKNIELPAEKIPEPKKFTEVVIKKGDTLAGISKTYKTDPKAIIELNNLSNESVIKVGSKILIDSNN